MLPSAVNSFSVLSSLNDVKRVGFASCFIAFSKLARLAAFITLHGQCSRPIGLSIPFLLHQDEIARKLKLKVHGGCFNFDCGWHLIETFTI